MGTMHAALNCWSKGRKKMNDVNSFQENLCSGAFSSVHSTESNAV